MVERYGYERVEGGGWRWTNKLKQEEALMWQERMLDEYVVLEQRGKALSEFLDRGDSGVNPEDRRLMNIQLEAMALYSVCLEKRMELHDIDYDDETEGDWEADKQEVA